ncbi:MAG: putative ATPase, partial [Deltaproteobacteria bacterium]|nr:putative ATPase [Deltaproteobacteria bacterium]
SPSETWEIGEQIGRRAKRGDLYAIYGELGAGKTQFVKGIAKGLGVEDWLYVVSPSFTIMNIYEGNDTNLCHVDLYRIDDSEFEPLSIEEFLEDGVVAVEWAERARWWDGIIQVDIEIMGEEERKIRITRA